LEVLNQTNLEKSILLTADKDFGELIFRQDKVAKGVILVRLAGLSPEVKEEVVIGAIAQSFICFTLPLAVVRLKLFSYLSWLQLCCKLITLENPFY